MKDTEDTSLASSLGEWLYWYGPSMEIVSQFYVSIIAALLVVFIVKWLDPEIKIWSKRRTRKIKKGLRKRKKTIKELQEIGWRPNAEEQRKRRNKLLRSLSRGLIWPMMILGAIASGATVTVFYLGEQSEETDQALRLSISDSIALFDSHAKALFQESTTRTNYFSECDFITSTEGRKWAESHCQNKIGSAKADKELSSLAELYQVCMIDLGWFAEKCNCADTDQSCNMIVDETGNCELARWRTINTYIGDECKGTVPEKIRKLNSEFECQMNADLYQLEKWYEGYTDYDRLSGTIQTYKLCMRRKGWTTVDCEAGPN